jgi:hypothetical protein
LENGVAEHPIAARQRQEWERIRRTGVWPFAIRRGLLRGVLLGVVVIAILELSAGHPIGFASLRDPAVLLRFAVAVALFSVGGVVSSYARWRSLDLRFGARAEE